MSRTLKLAAACSLAAVLALGGCTDTTPTQVMDAPAFFSPAPGPGLDVIRRNIPLAQTTVATRTIGPEGGRLDLREAGISVVVPPGAVLAPTRITVRALPGRPLAFELAPAGLQLEAPASILVGLRGTDAEDLLDVPSGDLLPNVFGVPYRAHRDLAKPIDNLRLRRSGDTAVVVTPVLMAGYATASG